jgi:hypothetical protein
MSTPVIAALIILGAYALLLLAMWIHERMER